MRFGQSAIAWPISSADLAIAQGTLAGMCFGGFMALDTGGSTPPFIVGDTFLKNVYSVYRAEPPSVGFANLSDTATAMNTPGGTVPTPTVGGGNGGTTATPGSGSNGAARSPVGGSVVLVAVLVGVGALW